MSESDSAAEQDVVRKLARGSFFSRLKSARQPLKLVAVPRDHVTGDRQRGEALLAGRFVAGSVAIPLADLDFASVGASDALAEQLQGFSWLRDLSAAASREKGAKLSEALVGRWLLGFPSFTPIDLYRRGHMAHHRDEFGPDEPDIPLYRGYPIARDSMRKIWQVAGLED